LTNPSQAAYETYVTDQTAGFLLQEVCNKQAQAPEIVAQALHQGCEALAHGNRGEIRRFVHQHTRQYNFGVISLYTTDLPGYQLRTLGLWHNFFIVSLG
jgi:methionine aminopeptidase